MRRNHLVILGLAVLCFGAKYTVTPEVTVSPIECVGFLNTGNAKTYNISETTFRNNPPKYYDLTDQGNIVIIKRKGGSQYQLIKI